MAPTRYRLAVLVSGSGTNLQALLEASRDEAYPAEVVVVISDRGDAPALRRASAAGIPVEVVPWSDDRDGCTKRVCDAAAGHLAQALVLAGFMRILGAEAIRRFPERIVNVHPSLLPAFRGAGAVERALEEGVQVTGATVHFVDELVDHGPIISQEAVAVAPGDDAGSLHARIQEVEHRILPAAVAALATGRLRIADGRVIWEGRAD